MKTIRTIIGIFILFLPLILKAELKEIPFTIDDRDRIIRTEQKVEALDAKIDMKIDGTKSEMISLRSEMTSLRSEMTARFDQLFNFLWAIIGIFTTMMVSVFGFAFWDRKLSLGPLKRENEKTLIVLRDYAKYQPKLHEILKNAGLL
jgi:predicted PurR-regulated permease PerM